MIVRALGDLRPQFAASVRGAENAAILGDVRLGENVTIWYSATLRGDVAPITVGAGSNVQDGCVLHCDYGSPLTIGRNVVIGHNATVHGCTVEDGCLIGMGATILNGAVIGAGSVIGAGALVPERKVIPPGSLVVGVPGKVVRAVTEEEQADILANAAHYVEAGRVELLPLEEC